MSDAARDTVRDDIPSDEAPHAEVPADDETTEAAAGPGPELPTAVESLVGALLEAGPEVAEHVVKAAQELLLAVQVVVDAADQAVQEQKDVREQRSSAGARGRRGGRADAGEQDATVRHLDLAE